jgi:hypothetical protein
MAIFAPTTTSGYSDPMKALSIKALEARQKDLLTAQAQHQPDAASMATIPGGIGSVLSQLGDSMQQSRAAATLAEQRGHLSQLIAGIDPKAGASQSTIAQIYALDPEEGARLMQQNASAQEHAAARAAAEASQQRTFTHSDTAQTAGFTHADAAARAKAETDELARQAAAEDARQAAAKQQEVTLAGQAPELVKMTEALKSGKIDQETFDAWKAKQTTPAASEMKAGNELQNTNLATQGALHDLKEARDLLGPDGTGIRAGAGAGSKQIGAKWGGDYLGISDPQATQRTERFNQIMSAEAITAMAEKLKGATTDFELKQFVALMNDPNAEGKTKVQALNNMIAKGEAHEALQQDQLKRSKLQVPQGPAATGAGPAAAGSPDAEALAWANANSSDPRAVEIKKRLGK